MPSPLRQELFGNFSLLLGLPKYAKSTHMPSLFYLHFVGIYGMFPKLKLQHFTLQVKQLQKQWGFEKVFAEAGGRPGEFTELAFTKLANQLKLEDDGTVSVVDAKTGSYVMDDKGQRVSPSEWLKQFKGHALLGYCFQPERGAGSGLVPHPGTALAQGADMHSLSTQELFSQAFGRKV